MLKENSFINFKEMGVSLEVLEGLVERLKKTQDIFTKFREICEESKKTHTKAFITSEEAALIIGCAPSLLANKRHYKNGPQFFKIAGKILEGVIDDKRASQESTPDPWNRSEDLFAHYKDGILVERSWPDYVERLLLHCTNNGYPRAWFDICKHLAANPGQAVFKNWFKNMVPFDLTSLHVRLVVKSAFYRDYINATYFDPLNKALKAVLPSMSSFEIEVGKCAPP